MNFLIDKLKGKLPEFIFNNKTFIIIFIHTINNILMPYNFNLTFL